MIVCGFDSAPVGIGWAYGEPGSVPTRGYRPNPNFGDNTARLGWDIFEWSRIFLKTIGADSVFIEEIIVRKHGFQMHVHEKQMTVKLAIEFACATIGLQDFVRVVDVADWRNEFYAGARAPRATKQQREAGIRVETDAWKQMAITECARRGWFISEIMDRKINHNIAEACGIWHYGCCFVDKRFRIKARGDRSRQQMKIDDARREAAS